MVIIDVSAFHFPHGSTIDFELLMETGYGDLTVERDDQLDKTFSSIDRGSVNMHMENRDLPRETSQQMGSGGKGFKN